MAENNQVSARQQVNTEMGMLETERNKLATGMPNAQNNMLKNKD